MYSILLGSNNFGLSAVFGGFNNSWCHEFVSYMVLPNELIFFINAKGWIGSKASNENTDK